MLSSLQLKQLRLFAQWLFVFVLLVCVMQPAAAANQPLTRAGAELSSGGDGTWSDTFAALVSERSYHTAVWTGNGPSSEGEMIVWGGISNEGRTNTGGRYNPATGVWARTSTVNAPSPRGEHTAVWTGTEMIVWGGGSNGRSFNDYSDFNTGGRYNPATDTWTPLSTTNAPSARHYHAAVWTGTEMIVWGGWGSSRGYLNDGARYNPSTDTWTAISSENAPTGRYNFTAVWTGTEMIIWGGTGYNANNLTSYLDTGARYDPKTDTWSPTNLTGAPSRRENHTAVWTGTQMIIWGGMGDITNTDIGKRYDPESDTWMIITTTDAPARMYHHTAVWTGTEMIIWGGDNGYYTGGRYDPTADHWIAVDSDGYSPAYFGYSAVWTGTEMIVWGGESNTGGRYAPTTNTWETFSLKDAPSDRYDHTAVWTGKEMIVWGGLIGSETNTGGRYSPTTNTWAATTTADAPEARGGYTVVWAGDATGAGEMIVWGGYNDYSSLNTGGRYDPETDTWKATSTEDGTLQCRNDHTAVWTGTEMIVWGGCSSNGCLNTGARYNPKTDQWKPMSTVNAPSGRSMHTAVWTGKEMIVWGGSRNENTGGRYNPETDTWTPISTLNAPDGRYNHTAVWTGTEMLVWGGWMRTKIDDYSDTYTYLNTGGRYNPVTNTWTPITLNNAPTERTFHTAVWTGKEMIIWGGYGPVDNTHPDLNTGGRYDPRMDTWKATSIENAPKARRYHTAVWTGSGATGAGEMIVWGGISILAQFNSGGRYTVDDPMSYLYLPMIFQAGK